MAQIIVPHYATIMNHKVLLQAAVRRAANPIELGRELDSIRLWSPILA